MKNYRFLGDEAEVLGNRLDQARKRLAESTTAWAKNYWSQNVSRLLVQWRQMPILHDGEAQTTIIPRWTIDYEFFEYQQEGNLYGVTDRFYDRLFKHSADLDASWHAHREQRLAKAQ